MFLHFKVKCVQSIFAMQEKRREKHSSKCEASGQENEENEKENEKACSLSRYTATNPAERAAMGIQIPSGEERSAKHIQKSKMMQQIALIKNATDTNHPQTSVNALKLKLLEEWVRTHSLFYYMQNDHIQSL